MVESFSRLEVRGLSAEAPVDDPVWGSPVNHADQERSVAVNITANLFS